MTGGSESMKLLQQGEIYEGDYPNICFAHTFVVYTDGDQIFGARTSLRLRETKKRLSELHGSPIPKERIYPKALGQNFTWVTGEASKSCHVKQPGLLTWEDEKDSGTDRWKHLMLHEARICEVLRRAPHPNVATYLGCLRNGSWITGLCFTKYKESLWDRIIIEKDGSLARSDVLEAVLAGIRNGIEHIHSLGYCHNDINATNIMFGDGNTPVIIDFDACCLEGESLGMKKGTVGWCDKHSKLSCRENDYHGLEKIKEFIIKHE